MKKREIFSLPAVGGSALLVVFAVLCLTVFSLLCLSTVLAEKRLSDAGAENVQAYYAADRAAQEIYARLRTGQQVDTVTEENGIYRYSCPISESQTLEVELRREGETWQVLRWQTVAHPVEEEEALPVWGGP